jgi:hypothetical protein
MFEPTCGFLLSLRLSVDCLDLALGNITNFRRKRVTLLAKSGNNETALSLF